MKNRFGFLVAVMACMILSASMNATTSVVEKTSDIVAVNDNSHIFDLQDAVLIMEVNIPVSDLGEHSPEATSTFYVSTVLKPEVPEKGGGVLDDMYFRQLPSTYTKRNVADIDKYTSDLIYPDPGWESNNEYLTNRTGKDPTNVQERNRYREQLE